MGTKVFSEAQSFLGEIHAAEGRFVLDYCDSRFTIELDYVNSAPLVVARIDSLSPELERNVRYCAFRLSDLPSLLSHGAQLLHECIDRTERGEQQKPGAEVCPMKFSAGGRS